jgi:hypothetical protein
VNVKSSLLLAIAVLAGCHHTPSPWDGQWTLDPSRSHYAAPVLTVTLSPSGEYRVDNGAFTYSFFCDGKELSAAPGRTTSCMQISPRAIALKGLADAVSTKAQWELSPDSKTLTITAERIQMDGSGEGNAGAVVKHQEKVFERISGTSGFAGQWKETKPLESLSKTVVLILNYSAFHVENSDVGQVSDSRAGDPPSPIRGANQPDGFTRSVQIVDPQQQLQTEDTFQSHVIQRTTWKVSDDGRTLTEESWTPATPTERNLIVYRRP